MNRKHLEIAKQLGIAIPTCLLSIGIVKSENTNTTLRQQNGSDMCSITKAIVEKNEVINHLIINSQNNKKVVLGHENTHSDRPKTHTDNHTNKPHHDTHTNRNATTSNGQCQPHSDTHVNWSAENTHTDTGGNRWHTDNHTDRPDAIKTCN